MQSKKVLISDRVGKPMGYDVVYLWDDRVNDERAALLSIPQLSEQNIASIRSKIAYWREKTLTNDDCALVKDLEFKPGKSAIWFSQLCELSPYKSDLPYFLIRIFQLEEELSKVWATDIHYRGEDERLHHVLKEYCDRIKINYTAEVAKKVLGKRRITRRMPHYFQAMQFMFSRWRTRLKLVWQRPIKYFLESEDLFVVYYPNFDRKEFTEGVFRSKYLPGIEGAYDKTPTWMWVYSEPRNHQFPRAVEDRAFFNEFTSRPNPREFIALVEDQISGKVFLRFVWTMIKMWFKNLGSRNYDLRTLNLKWDLSRALAPSLQSAFRGVTLASGLYYYFAFERLFSINFFSRVFFLYEGQPWEKALLLANSGAKTIAIQHSLVRPTDLRFFFDLSIAKFRSPNPDALFVNGSHSYELLKHLSYDVHEVEALRFNYLIGDNSFERTKSGRIVVFLDADPKANEQLMKTVVEGLKYSDREVTVRPYPGLKFKPIKDPKISFDTDSSISQLMAIAERVVVSNGAFMAIEAFSRGISPLVYLPKGQLNLFPLTSGVDFFWDAASLTHFLKKNDSLQNILPQDFFHLDSDLPRWRSALKDPESAQTYATDGDTGS